MNLFKIDRNGKFVRFREKDFRDGNKEIDLEILLENNPEYFFGNSKIMIIGRQVTTNLNTYIDLLGLDEFGNSVIIELKRGKTPRETISQLIEYASFIDNLNFEQLNEIYQDYSGEEVSLDEFHRQYFMTDDEDIKISWNKSSKLVIVAQTITAEIKQTSIYLRKKGLDLYCLEFKYFTDSTGNKIISSDYVVGENEFILQKVSSGTTLPKTDKEKFYHSLDKNGKEFFNRLFDFAEKNELFFRWGSKGFSMNLSVDNGFVAVCFGYPPDSVFKQSIYTGFEEIKKKVNNADNVILKFKDKLSEFGQFVSAKSNLKWIIDRDYPDADIDIFLSILKMIINNIRKEGLKE